jgi:hypothetical protein
MSAPVSHFLKWVILTLKGIVKPQKRVVESGNNRTVRTSQHGRCFYVILKGLGYLNFKKHVSAFRVKKGGVYYEGVQKKSQYPGSTRGSAHACTGKPPAAFTFAYKHQVPIFSLRKLPVGTRVHAP